ncbi:MAG: SDR family NAD(P)-dependent oxidoreductase [Betaproteobacteria bacterium]
MIDPTGRVVLISGANRGIGLALAQVLYAKGYTLSLGARDLASLSRVTAAMDPARIHTHRYDAKDWPGQAGWVDAAMRRFGRLDVLINNAGIGESMTIRNAEEAALDEIWAVNCKAPLNMIRCALPHLEASGSGRIVNIVSLSGKRVANDNIAYNMTKFAVMALTHGARKQGWDKGVRATALCPSFVRTDLTAGVTAITPEQMIDPADLAELAATIIALPNTAAVAELLVNCRFEAMV